MELKLLLILVMVLLTLIVSGCIEAATLGLQVNEQGPDNNNRWASEEGIDNSDSRLVDVACKMEFRWGGTETPEACNSLKVNVDDKVYNCKFDEEKNICGT